MADRRPLGIPKCRGKWKTCHYQDANTAYLDEGVKLLELLQQAISLYDQQSMHEKRRLLNFVCSNSVWKDGCLYPKYRQPFEILAVTNREYQRKKAASCSKSDLRSEWLPGPDSNQRPIG